MAVFTFVDQFLQAQDVPHSPGHFHSVRGGPWNASFVRSGAVDGAIEVHFYDGFGNEMDNAGFTAIAISSTHMGICGYFQANNLTPPKGTAWMRVYCRTNAIKVSQCGQLADSTGATPALFLRSVSTPDFQVLAPGAFVNLGWYP